MAQGDLTNFQCRKRLEEARKKVVMVWGQHRHGTFTPGQQKKMIRILEDLYDLIGAVKRK